MKRPIVLIAVFLGFGIATNFYIQNLVSIGLIAIGLFLVLLSFAIKFKDKVILCVYLFFILGYCLSNDRLGIDTTIDHEVNGIVKSIDTVGKYNNIVLKTNTIDGEKEHVNIILITDNSNVNISDNISFYGKLDDFSNSKKDFINNRSKNIVYKSYNFDVKINGSEKNISYYRNNLHNIISSNLDKILPTEQSAIVKAITIGEKDDLESSTKNLYKLSGIFHILVLSGLHVSIIATSILAILNIFIKGYKKNLIVILLLLLFLFFVDYSVSINRAVIMSICLLIAPVFYRQYDNVSSVFLAGFIILIFSPYALFSISFILTFACVACIVLLSDEIKYFVKTLSERKSNRLLNIISNNIDVLSPMISISLILPLVSAYFFYYIYPYSFLINILVLSFITPLVVLSFICIIVSFFSINLGTFIGYTVYFILKIVDWICITVNKLPFNDILVGKPNIVLLILYITLIGVVVYCKRHKWKYIISIVCMLVLVFIINNNILKIEILDKAVFIFDNEAVLLDCSTDSFYDNRNTIHSKGYNKVSTIITDNIDNTVFLQKENMLDKVYITNNSQMLDELKSQNIDNVIIVNNNEMFTIDKNSYYISGENVYMDNGYMSFSNIKDEENKVLSNVQNIEDYGIIVTNDNEKTTINKDNKETKLRIYKDKIWIR